MTVHSRSLFAFAAAFSIALLSFSSIADAQSSQSNRRFYAGVGMGAGIQIDDYPTQFKLTQEFGIHLSGQPEGAFVGVRLGQSFGKSVFTFQVGARIGYDIPIYRSNDFTILIAPSAVIGLARASVQSGFGRAGVSAFNLGGALDVKLSIGDGFIQPFLRPASMDLFINDNGLSVRYDVIAGVNLNF